MKKHIMVSVNAFAHARAKDQGLNISELCDDAIRRKVANSIKDLPEEALVLRCTQCLNVVEYGFYCSYRNIFLCQKCQDNYNMELCEHDKIGEHEHIRIPGFDGQNSDKIKKVAEKPLKTLN